MALASAAKHTRVMRPAAQAAQLATPTTSGGAAHPIDVDGKAHSGAALYILYGESLMKYTWVVSETF